MDFNEIAMGYGGNKYGDNSGLQKAGMIGGGLAGLGQGIYNSFFAKDPAKGAMGYLNQIPGQISPYYNPYVNAGQSALGNVQGQYSNLLNDPSALIQKLSQGYQQSPGFNFQRDQGLQAINNASAAGGMAGSMQHQQQAGELATNLSNQDFQQYLQHALGLYGQGLQGMQGLSDQGLNAGNTLAQLLGHNLENQSQLSYAGTANQNKTKSGGFGDILGGIGSLAALAFM